MMAQAPQKRVLPRKRLSTASMLEIDREWPAQQPGPPGGRSAVYPQQPQRSKSSTDDADQVRGRSAAAASDQPPPPAELFTLVDATGYHQQQQQQQQQPEQQQHVVNHASTAPQRLNCHLDA
uniref:Uncharacterized protein n=1 Tax=Macrostomum lignano TaxID=282301 RepID=A0A1I8F807_9PLAT